MKNSVVKMRGTVFEGKKVVFLRFKCRSRQGLSTTQNRAAGSSGFRSGLTMGPPRMKVRSYDLGKLGKIVQAR